MGEALIHNTIWFILLFPLLGVLINGFFGSKLGRRVVGIVGPAAVGLAFLAACGTFLGVVQSPHAIVNTLYSWITVGDFDVSLALRADPLSSLMTLVVSGVGFLIHVYSVGYMAEDERFTRFFTQLNLFAFSMLLLVLGNNFLVMFVGWELVGLCSYLLIGFWFEREDPADAGKKAFLVTRIGDFGFALGVMLIFATFRTLDFDQVFARAPELLPLGGTIATAITLLLFMGAVGKSAQIPLYVWLPDAMEGPTPVSALIHAATMVTAGVYMVARTHVLFELAPLSMSVVAWIGVITAFFAATIALVQNDLKRILAYSTISQLGYMFVGVGVGAYAAGIFHLTTHAFFKALLFLSAGSVMHALSGELNIQKMGGLKDKIRWTYWTFLAGALALSGFPFFSGFFSKDEILWKAYENVGLGLWLVGIVTAFMTAFYSFRLVFVPFWGQSRLDKKIARHVHESPRVMIVPLVALAVLAFLGGYVGLPHFLGGSAVEGFLSPVFAAGEGAHHAAEAGAHAASVGLEVTFLLISVGVALAGIGLAYFMYVVRPAVPVALARGLGPLYTLLSNKYYVDELYMAVVVNPLKGLASWLARIFDAQGIDGLVNGIAAFFGWSGQTTRKVQTGSVRNYALSILLGVVVLVGYFVLR
jgi:NADH-quinone oxidoreductase subunit L